MPDQSGIMAAFYKAFGCVLNNSLAIRKNHIPPIGFNVRSLNATGQITPQTAYPEAVTIDLGNTVEQDAVVIAASIQGSFKGNTAGDQFFLGLGINTGSVARVSSATNFLASIAYDLTNDLIVKDERSFSPYGGFNIQPATQLSVVHSGDGGGAVTIFYAATLIYVNELANALSR